MKIINTVVKEVEDCVDILCDKCGDSTKTWEDYAQTENATLSYHAGYGSDIDGTIWELHLCVECFKKTYEFITGKPLDMSDESSLSLPGLLRTQAY